MKSRYVFAAVGAVMLAGCDSLLCSEEKRTVELVYSDPYYEVRQELLDSYRSNGWKCTGATMRNAFGGDIGTQYTCTKCT